MATKTQTIAAEEIGRSIESLGWDVADLEAFSARTAEVTEDEVWDFGIEWDDTVRSAIPFLLSCAEAGSMSSPQIDRFDGLLSRLRAVSDVLTQFGLAVPERMEREHRQVAADA